MEHDKALTNKISSIIQEKRIKQKKIAQTLGIKPHDFSNMLNGRKQIISTHIPLIAEALGVEVGELFSNYVRSGDHYK